MFDVQIRDNSEEWDKLQKELKFIEGKVINIGILGSEGSQILLIANVNEFGVSITVTPKMRAFLHSQGLHLKKTTKHVKIPERSFIRGTAISKEREIIKFVLDQYDLLFDLRIDGKQFLDRIGVFCVGLTKQTLVNLKRPPNHPLTLQGKAPKTNPLVNTGTLVSRISYEVI